MFYNKILKQKIVLSIKVIFAFLVLSTCSLIKSDEIIKKEEELLPLMRSNTEESGFVIVNPTMNQVFDSSTINVVVVSDTVAANVQLNGKTMATVDNLTFTTTYQVPFDGKYKLKAIGMVGSTSVESEVVFEVKKNTVLWRYEQCAL